MHRFRGIDGQTFRHFQLPPIHRSKTTTESKLFLPFLIFFPFSSRTPAKDIATTVRQDDVEGDGLNGTIDVEPEINGASQQEVGPWSGERQHDRDIRSEGDGTYCVVQRPFYRAEAQRAGQTCQLEGGTEERSFVGGEAEAGQDWSERPMRGMRGAVLGQLPFIRQSAREGLLANRRPTRMTGKVGRTRGRRLQNMGASVLIFYEWERVGWRFSDAWVWMWRSGVRGPRVVQGINDLGTAFMRQDQMPPRV